MAGKLRERFAPRLRLEKRERALPPTVRLPLERPEHLAAFALGKLAIHQPVQNLRIEA